ncbi:MAG: glycoside hydrolase family 76 protein [Streptosporangiaceae bacterium]
MTPAAAAATALQRWYRPRSGLWSSTGWWNSANALTALIGYLSVTGDSSHTPVIERTFQRAPRRHPGFVNEYFDDCGWWALAWIDAHDLTGSPAYLSAAADIFDHMTSGWDDGMWWRAARDYKNAITSELFGLLAARLFLRSKRRDYLSWASRCWDWFAASGMLGPSGLVNDGLTPDGRNNGGTTWTYNQGVLLGFLAELHTATGSGDLLEVGRGVAQAAFSSLTEDGILTEPGIPDGDRIQFKGIFVRNLRRFAAVTDVPGYREFIQANAASVWSRARNSSDELGFRWQGPFDTADAARQSSALDLLTAAALSP